MEKEEFIKLIETLKIEKINTVKITYQAEKEYSYNDPKIQTICIGGDIETELFHINNEINRIEEKIYNILEDNK